MKRRWKVLLCGYYGMGNLGDELLASASIVLLEKCGVARDEIAMLSGDPEASARDFKVSAIDRWNIKEVFGALAGSESLLLGGGGIFQDSSSFLSPWYYWLIVRAAKFLGCRVWAAGQSIGPLSRWINHLLARDAFRCCSSVIVRDKHSEAFLSGRCVLSDDLALALPEEKAAATPRPDYLLVNFRRTGIGLEYKAAEALNNSALPAGCKVAGIALDKNDADLMETMVREKALALDDLFLASASGYSEIFSRGTAAFGMRLHFGVLCLKAGIPCCLVPYDPKVSDFARRWGGPVWTGGTLEPPAAWRNLNELPEVQKKIREDFSVCFEKVMHP